jgi:hypothetical protein
MLALGFFSLTVSLAFAFPVSLVFALPLASCDVVGMEGAMTLVVQVAVAVKARAAVERLAIHSVRLVGTPFISIASALLEWFIRKERGLCLQLQRVSRWWADSGSGKG